ncbi:MAG: hypothetical protein ABFS17_08845 [Chloroflexota bacterium]
MVSSDERMKILDMIQEGKLNVDDGARLLSALGEGASPRGGSRRRPKSNQTLRVRVSDLASGKTKVSANLPMALIDAGMSIASNFTVDVDGISLDQINDALQHGLTGKIVDVVQEDSGEHVEVFID